ncbi:MAG: sodium:solute symporter [Flavobacteriaceae bacterium]
MVLLLIAKFTSKSDSNEDFFRANRKAPWYLVAFGMVGTSLSGVTFISVPGWVGETEMTYLQVVFGYLAGYLVVAYVLLPLYYKQNLISIYGYLGNRFDAKTQQIGSFFFFVSRILGAAFRLYLVAIVLQEFLFSEMGLPFEVTVIISVFLIWIYTHKGGIKTIIITDTLQTLFMMAAVIFAISSILQSLNLSLVEYLQSPAFDNYNQLFIFDSLLSKSHFIKSFVGGMFITICMTGLDQDMMQKNLSCKSLIDAQKNMVSFSFVLVLVTFLFVFLGGLLFYYSEQNGVGIPLMGGNPKTDLLFPEIALSGDLGIGLSVFFLLGLIAAAYSSADSALTALTTAFCIDFIHIENLSEENQQKMRKKVHIGLSFLLVLVIVIFNRVISTNVIDSLLVVAGYTYGPLLGLFSFGMFTKHKIAAKKIMAICLSAVVIIALIAQIPAEKVGGYVIGYELLPLNGLLTFCLLYLFRDRTKTLTTS